jgi:hypothetical protein|tara:strand:+ start:565 stop:837 length:273 start_codon:yes stop_codon:yes gene_type:complete
MRALTYDAVIGKCVLCKLNVCNNEAWINTTSINVGAKWVCGECLVELQPAVKDACKAYNKEKHTPEKYKVKNTYNVTVDPATGRLTRGKL